MTWVEPQPGIVTNGRPKYTVDGDTPEWEIVSVSENELLLTTLFNLPEQFTLGIPNNDPGARSNTGGFVEPGQRIVGQLQPIEWGIQDRQINFIRITPDSPSALVAASWGTSSGWAVQPPTTIPTSYVPTSVQIDTGNSIVLLYVEPLDTETGLHFEGNKALFDLDGRATALQDVPLP
jgi:hypothetical protein